MENRFSKQIFYTLSILGACILNVSMIALAGYGVYRSVIQLINKQEIDWIVFASFCGAVLCFALDRILFEVRTTLRDDLEFDENGNKRKNEYKRLSAKEKAVIDREKLIAGELIISESEIKRMTHQGSKDPIGDMEKLVGLADIKEEIIKMHAMMEYAQTYKKEMPSAHYCFTGSPGTGKTTVARILTGILYQYKYIKKNQCLEVDGSVLKGRTPDETLQRTRRILQKSKGGVLFIDEAYSLLYGVNSDEIITELVKYMEDNKKEFVLILAGYKNEMEELIDANPGLYSRINKYWNFKDYDITELKEIFRNIANQAGYFVDENAYDEFEISIMKEKNNKNFGNARTVRNIFEKTLEKHAYNVIKNHINKKQAFCITAEDIA